MVQAALTQAHKGKAASNEAAYRLSHRSIKHGDAIDLDIDALPVRRSADAGAGHLFSMHKLAEGFIEFGKIRRIAKVHPHVDDVFQARTPGVEHAHQIGQRLDGLFDNVVRDHFASVRVQRSLTGNEQGIAPSDRLREGGRGGLVGKTGGWRSRRGDENP